MRKINSWLWEGQWDKNYAPCNLGVLDYLLSIWEEYVCGKTVIYLSMHKKVEYIAVSKYELQSEFASAIGKYNKLTVHVPIKI